MLLSKTVKTIWSSATKKYYEGLGYKYTKMFGELEVKVEDLPIGSHAEIICLYDYCLEDGIETIITKSYKRFIKGNLILNKDACAKCSNKKSNEIQLIKNNGKYTFETDEFKKDLKEYNLNKHGVEHYSQSKEFKEKFENTCLERYDCINVFQNEDIKNKIKQSNLNKYGVEHYSKTPEYQEKLKKANLERYGQEYYSQTDEYDIKIKNTCQERYGVDNVFQDNIVKEKIKQTCIKRYGVDSLMKNKEFALKLTQAAFNTMSKNGTMMKSKQQEHLNNLLNGKINYLVGRCFLDIAFPDEKIYIEYQGSGHKLAIKFGDITDKQFFIKEIARYKFLKSLGWKQIEIISIKDFLPEDNIILNIINFSKKKLDDGYNWIRVDIDNGLIATKGNIENYDFGKLHKLN